MRNRIFTVLVCGGRDYRNAGSVNTVLDGYAHSHGPFKLVQGGATGADALAREWAYKQPPHKLHSMVNMPADWKTLGRKAGPIRNQRMLDEQTPDVVVAFPGGNGTADMTDRAVKAGVEVIYINV